MELTINKTRGLIDLIEFRTTERLTIFFDNNFGMIKGNELLLYRTMLTFNMNEIISIKLVENKEKFSTTAVYFKIMAIALLFFELNIVLLLAGLVAVLLFLFFKRPKEYFLRIEFRDESSKSIIIEKRELNDVTSFIKAFNNYKTV